MGVSINLLNVGVKLIKGVKLTSAVDFSVTLEAREAFTQEVRWQIAALCVGDAPGCHCGVIALIDVCKIKTKHI